MIDHIAINKKITRMMQLGIDLKKALIAFDECPGDKNEAALQQIQTLRVERDALRSEIEMDLKK